jgi:hypothetical protein
MSLVAFGVFLDAVLIGREEKKRIEQYLDSKVSGLSFTQRFLSFLTLSHSVVFGRFFSGNLFSKSFFASAAIVSITSFVLVAAIQIYFDGDALTGVRFDFFSNRSHTVFYSFQCFL